MTTSPAPASNGWYQVMCLGDSITAGATTDGGNGNNGYRADLQDALYWKNERHEVVMVGSQLSGTANLRHEGHSGITIQSILTSAAGWLANPAGVGPPQCVILLAGSNDLPTRTAQQILADTDTLARQILALLSTPNLVIFEQLPQSASVDHQKTINSQKQKAINRGLPALVAALPVGRVAVARTSIIPQDDLDGGGVHPKDPGYRKMSELAYAAVEPWLGWPQGDGYLYMSNRPSAFGARPEAPAYWNGTP